MISRPRLLGYGLGSVGSGMYNAVPGLLLLYYLTDVLGVAAAIAGFVLVLPKLWDMLLNPYIGTLTDRVAVRTGNRTPFLLAGALSLPLCFAAMFASPAGVPALVWVTAAFLLAATAFSAFQVPYVALPTEMASTTAERTRVVSWRIVCLTIGILLAGGLAPLIVDLGGGGRTGHTMMGVSLGAVLLAVLLISALSTRWVVSRPGPRPLGLAAALRTARGNRPFFTLLAAFMLQALATAVMLAGAPYVAVYHFADYGLTSVMFAALVAPSAVAVPVWSAAARRFGHLPCYLWAVGVFALAVAALVPSITAGALVPSLALIAVLGVCYAALQLLPLSLLPDTVHGDTPRTGHAQAGAFTGLWTAGETASLAVGPGLYSAVLVLSGFVSSSFDTPVQQPDSAVHGLTLGFTLLPALLMLASLPFVLAYRRSARRHAVRAAEHEPAAPSAAADPAPSKEPTGSRRPDATPRTWPPNSRRCVGPTCRYAAGR
jgi:glycoside/pentoside/hexuronide:cation symporter, GPH family